MVFIAVAAAVIILLVVLLINSEKKAEEEERKIEEEKRQEQKQLEKAEKIKQILDLEGADPLWIKDLMQHQQEKLYHYREHYLIKYEKEIFEYQNNQFVIEIAKELASEFVKLVQLTSQHIDFKVQYSSIELQIHSDEKKLSSSVRSDGINSETNESLFCKGYSKVHVDYKEEYISRVGCTFLCAVIHLAEIIICFHLQKNGLYSEVWSGENDHASLSCTVKNLDYRPPKKL